MQYERGCTSNGHFNQLFITGNRCPSANGFHAHFFLSFFLLIFVFFCFVLLSTWWGGFQQQPHNDWDVSNAERNGPRREVSCRPSTTSRHEVVWGFLSLCSSNLFSFLFVGCEEAQLPRLSVMTYQHLLHSFLFPLSLLSRFSLFFFFPELWLHFPSLCHLFSTFCMHTISGFTRFTLHKR